MIKVISFVEKCLSKMSVIYRKRLFKEATGQDVASVKILGKLNLINKNITVGKRVTFYPDVTLFGDGPIVIGDNVSIGSGTLLYASKDGGGITIGSNTQIAAQCYIIDTDHGIKAGKPIREQQNTVSPISIGEDAWIGADCKILKGSKIGDGAVIGAMSLVKGDIDNNSICVGIPAKTKKIRE